MSKEANNQFPLLDIQKKRWSPRAFSSQAVEKEKLQSLFEAARWSASGGNQQPWRFIVGLKGDETYQKILQVMEDSNAEWAITAPVVVLTIGNTLINSKKGANSLSMYDVGQSVAHLSIQATALGLYVHQMSGLYPDKAVDVFAIPEDFKPLTIFTVGYLGDPGQLSPYNQKRELAPRERLGFDELVFTDKFGNPSGLF